ncbi:MAG: hypothetical protein M3134_10870 [Actinomycetota bacterium]|nr:hypothetical protein [Actinomycetota bacterium]
MLSLTAYGWRVVPDTTRFAVRWGLFASADSSSKRSGLLTWLFVEGLVLAGAAAADNETMSWVGFGLLTFLLLLHFSAIRRLRSHS